MITLLIILVVVGIFFGLFLAGLIVLLDPIICILAIWGIYKLISKLCNKRASKKK